MNFNEFCRMAKVTPAERDQVAWFLAQYRAKRIYDELKTEEAKTP